MPRQNAGTDRCAAGFLACQDDFHKDKTSEQLVVTTLLRCYCCTPNWVCHRYVGQSGKNHTLHLQQARPHPNTTKDFDLSVHALTTPRRTHISARRHLCDTLGVYPDYDVPPRTRYDHKYQYSGAYQQSSAAAGHLVRGGVSVPLTDSILCLVGEIEV